MVADGDPRRGKVIGWYLRVQHVLLRLWMVVVVTGGHCVDDGPFSGGWWFGEVDTLQTELQASNWGVG